MYNEETTFVLGAGASFHYGYPTGETLVEEIKSKATQFEKYCSMSHQNGAHAPNCFRNFASSDHQSPFTQCAALFSEVNRRLTVTDPLVIDYFLGQNSDLAAVGKFLIAWILLGRELYYAEGGNVKNRPDRNARPTNENWLRFVIHKMLLGCKNFGDVKRNPLYFVTFNYDVSLEAEITKSLANHKFLEGVNVEEFFADDRVIHVYGSVKSDIKGRRVEFFELSDPQALSQPGVRSDLFAGVVDEVQLVSDGIYVIDPDTKMTNEAQIVRARSRIAKSSNVYILGYGFDENNNNRLELVSRRAKNNQLSMRNTYFTNFGDSNRVNRTAGALFAGPPLTFMTPGGTTLYQSGTHRVEKSIKSTYDALALDFDA